MFGLQSPLSKPLSRKTSEFDSVNTILSNSIYKDERTFWSARKDDKGSIFYLEIDPEADKKKELEHTCQLFCNHSNQCSSHNGFSTDDTGYGTDTDNSPINEHKEIHSILTKNLRNSSKSKHLNSESATTNIAERGKCTCKNETVDFFNMNNIREVSLKIDTDSLRNNTVLQSLDRSRKAGQIGRALCKSVLGIVPGHFRDASNKTSKSKGQRLCVRGLIRDSLAARNQHIRIGDCLRLVNEREVTWDNIDDVFKQLTYSKQVRLVLQEVSGCVPVLVKENLTTDSVLAETLIEEQCYPDLDPQQSTHFSVIYINLKALNSEEGPADRDIFYQYPKGSHTLAEIRGCFITLWQVLGELSETNIKRSSFVHEGEVIHVGYDKEENGLLLFMYPANRMHGSVLPFMVKDVVRVLRVQYGSVQDAFSLRKNYKELDMFFSLFHKTVGVQRSDTCVHSYALCSLGNVQYLPLCNVTQEKINSISSKWESADFMEMSDSFYGCRRSYTILGSCTFHKAWMLCSHLPKEDLHDLYLYLKYHSLLTLCESESIQQLVIWREIHPTRQWYDLGEEQMFGYTEPVAARYFWLIVGYKHTLFCSLFESGGCTSVVTKDVPAPDPFYIDQAKSALMQIIALDLSTHCETNSGNPLNSLVCPVEANEGSPTKLRSSLRGSFLKGDEDRRSSHKRLSYRGLTRKESFESDGSGGANSTGSDSSIRRRHVKTRLFPTEVLSGSTRDDNILTNDHIKLTIGAENCLLHFINVDKMDGIFISPLLEPGSLEKEILHNFHLSCTHIKHMFDRYRYRKKPSYRGDNAEENIKLPVVPDTSFFNIREEGVLFTVKHPEHENKSFSYWTVGRQRSRMELYVCFKDSTPQCMVELAFRMGFGLKL